MDNKNLILLAGGALLILMFLMFVLSQNNRNKLMMGSAEGQNSGVMMEGPEGKTVTLSPQGNSSESGVATLRELDGRVTVSIYVTGSGSNVAQPAHIHAGACPGVGAVVYPLNSLVNGRSDTVINASMADLMQQMPLAINVHKSADEINVYTSCGNL